MKMVFKGIAFALTAAVLLSLCLTPSVFATEGVPVASSSDAEEVVEEDIADEDELLMASPSDAENITEEMELLAATFFNPAGDTVSTGEELKEWLSGHKGTGGTVTLADDISLSDFYYARNRGAAAVTVVTGEYSIEVDGYVYLQATSPLTIRGVGGEQGVLRTSGEGSRLHLYGLALEAEDGYAVFQEEGTGCLLENTSVSGAVHYAKQPFVWEWEPALAVVGREETLDAGTLPATVLAYVNQQGQNTYFPEEVPVTWDLAGHEEDQKLRRRFAVTGVFEDMLSQAAPVCTIAYDDFPLTFLEVNVMKIAGTYGDSYRFNGTFSKPEDRLPITVEQEYSFDGGKWMLYDKQSVTTSSRGFTIISYVGKEDQASVSELFIRLSWKDDNTVYYSNVLRFAADSLEANEEPGGNRGGGTDIIDPPGPPETDPIPETTPPEIDPAPETAPPPVTSTPSPNRPEHDDTDHGAGENDPSYGIVSKPGPSIGPSDSGPGQPPAPDAKDETREDVFPVKNPDKQQEVPAVSDRVTAPPVSKGSAGISANPKPGARQESETASSGPETVSQESETASSGPEIASQEPEAAPLGPETASQEPEAASQGLEAASQAPEPATQEPEALPVAAGLAAVAVCMGGAALYLHPRAWEKLLRKLRNIMKH